MKKRATAPCTICVPCSCSEMLPVTNLNWRQFKTEPAIHASALSLCEDKDLPKDSIKCNDWRKIRDDPSIVKNKKEG
jgi:hypothetical protein